MISVMFIFWFCPKLQDYHCENTVSRKCEYWGLTITSDTNVSSHALKTCDLTRLLYHVLFPKPYSTHISALTVLALLKIVEKAIRNTNERKYPFHSSMFLLNVTLKVNVVTCEYIDFYLTA
jgi:hypothetical protein